MELRDGNYELFKGLKGMFNLHLKECEFKFNNRKQNFACDF